jgi:hypothetical protein
MGLTLKLRNPWDDGGESKAGHWDETPAAKLKVPLHPRLLDPSRTEIPSQCYSLERLIVAQPENVFPKLKEPLRAATQDVGDGRHSDR